MALNTKITLSLLLLVLLLSALVGWASQHQAEVREQLFLQELHRALADNLVKEMPLIDNGEISTVALEGIFGTMMAVNPSIEVYLLDPAGTILMYSAPYKRVQMDHVDLEPLRAFLEPDARFPITGDNPREPDIQRVFSATAVVHEGAVMGYLYVVLGGDLHQAAAGRAAWTGLAWNAGVGVVALGLFALVCGGLFRLTVSRRLGALNQDVSRFRRAVSAEGAKAVPIGGTKASTRPGQGDELDHLAHSCGNMSKTILRQLEQLTYTDQMRRQLVANVSHDLRTPLASLEGYLETVLLKHEDLSPDQTRQHVDTAYQSAQRLRRLIAELFELARLEADDREPSLEPFSIAELASDVVQKLRVIAHKRRIDLKLEVQDNAHFAVAEIGLIERVLENLLINAIQHSPDDGEVRLTIKQARADRVSITVIDEGAGIAERELPRIFDRFYRPDHGADHRTEGAGLGLAIVKRIIDLHHSHIEATSRPGHGSAFAFWLPTKVPSMA
ncbi:MAG: ATP-binding protein [Pseudomonadota bacterium]